MRAPMGTRQPRCSLAHTSDSRHAYSSLERRGDPALWIIELRWLTPTTARELVRESLGKARNRLESGSPYVI